MGYAKTGKYIMLASFILTVFVVLITEPLSQIWAGLLMLVFFLFGIGLTLTGHGESSIEQKKNSDAVVKKLKTMEGQLDSMEKTISQIVDKLDNKS